MLLMLTMAVRRAAEKDLGERQVNSYQHAAQASVFRGSLAGASRLYLGEFSSAARLTSSCVRQNAEPCRHPTLWRAWLRKISPCPSP